MPKQVWQVADGGIFETKEEALAWENEEGSISELLIVLDKNTSGIRLSDMREIASVIVANYNVTPK